MQVKTGEAGDFVHFFVCLVKCAGQVIPTTMVATADGLEGNSLHFPNLIKFRDLSKDFAIHLEVYGLQTRREVLGHEAKYHIAGPNKPGLLAQLTPKMKFSKTESRLARPPVASPGGPHSVRTSSFAMVGQTVITLGSLGDKGWRLSSVPQISPLEGTVHLTLNGHSESQVTHKGLFFAKHTFCNWDKYIFQLGQIHFATGTNTGDSQRFPHHVPRRLRLWRLEAVVDAVGGVQSLLLDLS